MTYEGAVLPILEVWVYGEAKSTAATSGSIRQYAWAPHKQGDLHLLRRGLKQSDGCGSKFGYSPVNIPIPIKIE